MNGQQLYERMMTMSEEERRNIYIPGWWDVDDVRELAVQVVMEGGTNRKQETAIEMFDDDDFREILDNAAESCDEDRIYKTVNAAIMDEIIAKADDMDVD